MLIYLIGAPGSGKTTYGKKLASKLNFNFIDIDNFIEKNENCSISDIFKYEGENYFRIAENKYLLEISKITENTVISTGGGTPCFFNNIEIINNSGISFYLKTEIESLTKRLENSKKTRPLINTNINQYIKKIIDEREKYYIQATHTITLENNLINSIINIIKPT
jgi:shikimate kinase